jgi:hypothetical protein
MILPSLVGICMGGTIWMSNLKVLSSTLYLELLNLTSSQNGQKWQKPKNPITQIDQLWVGWGIFGASGSLEEARGISGG